jgi:hypothetical protein
LVPIDVLVVDEGDMISLHVVDIGPVLPGHDASMAIVDGFHIVP